MGSNSVRINAVTKALIDAGIINQMIDAPHLNPDEYVFGLDDKVDAKLFPRIIRTAYTAVLGAILRENGNTTPLFDEEDERESTYDPKVDGATPSNPLSYADALHYAAAIYRMAVSQGRHEDGRWLLGMTKRTVTKSDDGSYHVEVTSDTPIKPFTEWLVDEKARTPDTENWFASIVYAQQLGADVPPWHEGVDEARSTFQEWLADVPWTRDNLFDTRKERIVGQCADKKWEALKLACLAHNEKQVSKLLDDWTLLCHSNKRACDIGEVKASATYKAHMLREAQEKQLEELNSLEFEAMLAETKLELKATAEMIKARRIEIEARLAAATPTVAEQLDVAQPKAAANNKKVKSLKEVKSLMPNVIEGRRAAH